MPVKTTTNTETIKIRYSKSEVMQLLIDDAGPGFTISEISEWDADESTYIMQGYMLTKVTETT